MKLALYLSLAVATTEAQKCFLPYLNASTALKGSKATLPTDGPGENTAPYDLPAGYTARKITDRRTFNRTGTFPIGFSSFDMITYAAPENTIPNLYPDAANFIFVPFETSAGGLLRYNTIDGSFLILAQGNASLPRNPNPATFDITKDNFQAIDPSTFTPFNTVLFAEEVDGGRIFEVQNPFAATAAAANTRWLSKVPAIAHEGLRFDKAGTLYFIDEDRSGCLYKYVPKVPGNLGVGQSFALRVPAYQGNVTLNWDANLTSPRVGAAIWIPITDINGNKLTVADPFQYNDTISLGGRDAGDEVLCTPYGRPEDIVISTDKDGREVMYVATTSENAVYSVVLLTNTTAEVKVFCDRNTINIVTGLPVGSNFTSPDNLAIDFGGTIYVVEDQAPPVLDIWQAVDANNDGVAEYLALWMTSGVAGSENTGLMFHPNEVNTAIVAVQHPSSGNDAIWEIKYNVPNKTENIPDLTSKTALNASKAALPIGGVEENTIPFNTPSGYTYRKITDVRTLNSTGAWPRGFLNWDMVAYSAPEGAAPGSYPDAERYLFIPMETGEGGLARYDTVTGTYLILARGNNSFPRNPNPATFDITKDNFQAVDPATFTPFNTVIWAEETTGGRIFEVQNPFAATAAAANTRWLSKIPAIAHEGLRFDKDRSLYFVDESNTGCLYKYVPKVPGNLSVGQSFALRVTAYQGNPTLDWNANLTSPRVGAATWVPITDIDGNKVTVADPFQYNASISTGGRAAGDEVFCTPYGRPEDIAIGTDCEGREIVYFTATSENAVYAITLLGATTANVKIFCDRNTIDIATGLPVGSAFTSPDNLAIDYDGTIYVVEDQAPAVLDVWQAIDLDKDGVADYLARWLTSGITGSEFTGLIFHPNRLRTAIIAVQHPSSNNDAIWEINFGPSPAPVPFPVPVPVPVALPAPVSPPVPANRPTNAPFKANTRAPAVVPVSPVVPVAKTPSAAPVKAPTPAPQRDDCGLFGLNIFCPFTFCGLFGRLLRLCD